MLSDLRPKMEGVNCTTPPAQDCKVETGTNASGKTIWKLVDRQGQLVRRVVLAPSGRPYIFQYYRDGLEVYREVDSKQAGRPDQFHWINDGGMKCGIDFNGDGKIDSWKMISSEEVGQEAFQAIMARDFERIRILFITEAEMQSLRLSDKEIARIKGQLARAPEKFRATVASLNPSYRFRQVEAATPSRVLGETIGMENDLIHFPTRLILYEAGRDAKGMEMNKYLQTGEMIQVGSSWRLADVPGDDLVPPTDKARIDPNQNPRVEELKDKIGKLNSQTGATPALETNRLVSLAALMEQLLSAMEPQNPEREMWYMQLLDTLAAAGGNHPPSLERLGAFRAQLEKAMPGSKMAAYAAYREICASFLVKMSQKGLPQGDVARIQDQWHDALKKFVQMYPNMDDTPDALRYLAVGAEFSGRDAQAKGWYEQIYKNFPNDKLAEMARGAVRRIDSIGQPMELDGPKLGGGGNYNISQSRGKVVAVYYWASYCESCPDEFVRLKALQSAWGAKGFELVCVNLDDDPANVNRFMTQNPTVGIHLFQQGKGPGSMTSPLATHYGINGLPTMFLVDKQGKVINRTLQVRDLEDALRRAL
jgi:thiol-disulfide isomerase/thioredoxin